MGERRPTLAQYAVVQKNHNELQRGLIQLGLIWPAAGTDKCVHGPYKVAVRALLKRIKPAARFDHYHPRQSAPFKWNGSHSFTTHNQTSLFLLSATALCLRRTHCCCSHSCIAPVTRGCFVGEATARGHICISGCTTARAPVCALKTGAHNPGIKDHTSDNSSKVSREPKYSRVAATVPMEGIGHMRWPLICYFHSTSRMCAGGFFLQLLQRWMGDSQSSQIPSDFSFPKLNNCQALLPCSWQTWILYFNQVLYTVFVWMV